MDEAGSDVRQTAFYTKKKSSITDEYSRQLYN